MIHIEPLGPERADEAAAMFTGEFGRLRQTFPMLAPDLQDAARVAELLNHMHGRSLAAVEDGQLVGFLTWWEVDGFRGAPRRGAYVPEWGYGARAGRRAEIYRALYRPAAAQWVSRGCTVHAITLLAGDEEAQAAWFWNGFGLAVVDAVRPVTPLDPAPRCSLSIRRANVDDAAALSELDAEHVQHYVAPPVFMAPPNADSAATFAEFIQRPKNSVWLVLDETEPGQAILAGFMRFTGYDFDAVAVLQSDSAAFCNGAYVRSAYRGRGAGPALLQAALTHYANLGLNGLFVNFESFNPEAASFWPRYFYPTCLSMMRVPEVLPDAEG